MAVESAVNNSVLKELVEPAFTRPTAQIPVITVVNLCRRALTLATRGVQITVTDLTPFLLIQSYGGLAAKMLKSPNSYAWKLHMRTYIVPVQPNGRAAQGRDAYAWLPSVRTHGVQKLISRFCSDPFVPFALSGHFRSELCLLNPKIHERTHQGIVKNGK
ncbi:hypothetical protein PIB30_037840 [Stylosanthes scabra]|uniref:Uncharacterized protein n=1 Tax=Stylosanthes scabra TaxID=79078 RepID=A0ABU6TEV0_9FABA|nr:hypothetical protein [Stylosanthes scabra]